jgi:hypothetical protein
VLGVGVDYSGPLGLLAGIGVIVVLLGVMGISYKAAVAAVYLGFGGQGVVRSGDDVP